MTSDERLTLMKKLRTYNLTDKQIGCLFDVSRQRVTQILGPRREDDFLQRQQRSITQTVMSLAKRGYNMHEMQSQANLTIKQVRSGFYHAKVAYSDFAPARQKRKVERIADQIRDFLQKHPGRLVSSSLMRNDRVLYNRMWTTMPIPEWRKYLGVE